MTREEEREGGGFWRIWWICHYCDCARCQFNQTRNFSSLVFLNIHSGKNGIMVIPCPNITTIHRLPQNVQMQRTESVNLSQIDGTLICDKLWCIRDCKQTYWNSPMSLSFTYNRNCSLRRLLNFVHPFGHMLLLCEAAVFAKFLSRQRWSFANMMMFLSI